MVGGQWRMDENKKAGGVDPEREGGRLPAIHRIFVLVSGAFAMLFLATACTTASDHLNRQLKLDEPVSRVFYAKYEDVESALKHAMIRYPQRIDNTEAGVFETDYLKGEARFKAAHKDIEYPSGYRYRILVRLIRGRADDGPAIKVLITKKSELARDFFADPEPLRSDGFEEEALLYRIGRELLIARALQKAAEQSAREESGMNDPAESDLE